MTAENTINSKLVLRIFILIALTSFRNEVRKIFKHPFVFQGEVDNTEKFLGCSYDCLATSFPGFDTLVEVPQIGRIPDCDQRTLYQCSTTEFTASFGNSPLSLCLVRVTHPGHDPKVCRQLLLILKIINITNLVRTLLSNPSRVV